MHKNIILIGFMGVGKGQTARALAKKLGRFAIDGDDMIESFANKKIKQIFDEEGEAAFRSIEADLANFLQKGVQGAIISTGGGFYKQKNLKKIGTVIYLKSSFNAIITRMTSSPNAAKKFAKRPLLKNLKEANRIFDERTAQYAKKADFTVSVEGKTTETVVNEIAKFLTQKSTPKKLLIKKPAAQPATKTKKSTKSGPAKTSAKAEKSTKSAAKPPKAEKPAKSTKSDSAKLTKPAKSTKPAPKIKAPADAILEVQKIALSPTQPATKPAKSDSAKPAKSTKYDSAKTAAKPAKSPKNKPAKKDKK